METRDDNATAVYRKCNEYIYIYLYALIKCTKVIWTQIAKILCAPLVVICYTVCIHKQYIRFDGEKVNLLQIDWIFWFLTDSFFFVAAAGAAGVLCSNQEVVVSFECWTNIDTRTSNFTFGSSILNACSWTWHLYSYLHFRKAIESETDFFVPSFLQSNEMFDTVLWWKFWHPNSILIRE